MPTAKFRFTDWVRSTNTHKLPVAWIRQQYLTTETYPSSCDAMRDHIRYSVMERALSFPIFHAGTERVCNTITITVAGYNNGELWLHSKTHAPHRWWALNGERESIFQFMESIACPLLYTYNVHRDRIGRACSRNTCAFHAQNLAIWECRGCEDKTQHTERVRDCDDCRCCPRSKSKADDIYKKFTIHSHFACSPYDTHTSFTERDILTVRIAFCTAETSFAISTSAVWTFASSSCDPLSL